MNTPEATTVPTFADDRDDDYFDMLMAQAGPIGSTNDTAVQAWIAKAEAVEAAARTKELSELKYLWSLGDSDALRFDAQRKSFRWWTPDDTSYIPDPEVIDERNVPAVVVFRGAAWDIPSYEYVAKTNYTPQELLTSLLPTPIESPDAGDLPHRTIHTDSEDAVELREQMDDDLLAWSLRDSDESWIAGPEFEQTDEEKTRRDEERAEWRIKQTAFLKMKLHRLLREYFRGSYLTPLKTPFEQVTGRLHSADGISYFEPKCLVTRWADDKRTPLEKIDVLTWIADKVEEKGELSGFASLCRSIEYRLAKRRERDDVVRPEASWANAA